jgi:hypothetical protein
MAVGNASHQPSYTAIDADCPIDDVVLAGGYDSVVKGGGQAPTILGTRPNVAFDGWMVVAGPGYGATSTIVTVWASCAPAR